ncbi:MAG: hydantoinase B/oxoprolinase family protein [Acidimicrobiia bacterium]|nr:hydantoinase B/oxoprolinase family protein [Acidimicrobiia bacterium]MYC85016.1 hydantoinase B/oxoprolinase family protein [Acidimicrobiia bacterium]
MIDAITTEIIRHGLLSACEEMARNLCRTSYNTVVYETHDYGVGLHDVNGDIAADAPGIAVFTRGNDYGIKRSIEFLGTDAMKPGDVFINNYPYWSSAHTLDTLVFAPIHVDGRLVGFASCRCHVLDLKQKDPGYVLDSTDMYQEGIFFPVVKLYREGEINEDIFNIVRFNSRLPNHTIGDIQAEVSAVVTGVRRTREIAEKFGVETLTAAMDAINVHGERLALAALRRMPKGTWSAEDYLDNDGVDLDRPIKMAVTITITDDEMIVDWTGSDEGVRGPINLPRGMTEAFNCLIFKGLTTPEWPVTAGNFRPLRVITKEGSVMHAVPPMPTFTLWTGLLGGEVMLKALAQGMPDRVPACSGGDVCSVMALGVDPRTGGPWLEGMNDAVGFGAHAGGDGEDGIMHLSEPGCRNNPVEVLEVKGPVMIDHYGYRPDTGGPGKHRGGVGISRVYRFLAPSTAISIVYKTLSPPWGINGGKEAEPNHIVIDPGTENEERKGGSYNFLEAGQVLANNTGGGGGWGNPFERDPALVAKDVRNGFVSVEAAERDYGVAVDPATFSVDTARTATLRA